MLDRKWVENELAKLGASDRTLPREAREFVKEPSLKCVQSGLAGNPHDIALSLKRRLATSKITGTNLLGGAELIEILEGMENDEKVYELMLSAVSGRKQSLLAVADSNLKLLGCMLIKPKD